MPSAVPPFGAIAVFRLVQAAERLIERLRGPRPAPRLSESELAAIGLGERRRPAARDDLVARALAYRV